MSQNDRLASGAITAVDTVTIEARRGQRNPGDRHRRMTCQGTAFHPCRSVWRGCCCPRSPPPS